MQFYKPVHFQAYEFLPPEIYEVYGDAGLIAMDARILWTLDSLRNALNAPIIVNTWFNEGDFFQRGLRTDAKLLEATPLSQHRFGRAVDFDIQGMSAEDFRQEVRDQKYSLSLLYVTRIEDGINWVHLDCANTASTEIEFFHA